MKSLFDLVITTGTYSKRSEHYTESLPMVESPLEITVFWQIAKKEHPKNPSVDTEKIQRILIDWRQHREHPRILTD